MPRFVLSFLCLLLSVMLRAADTEAIVIHVSPRGSDSADGSAEKPVASPARAVAIALEKNAKKIVVHAGTYYDVSLTVGPELSGLTIEGAPGETALLYGGVALHGWEKDGENFVAAKLPDLPGRKWEARMLLVDGQMCTRARLPESGKFTHLTSFDVPWMSTTGGGWKRKPTQQELTTLKYKPADVPAALEATNAEVTVFHMWDESCVGVAANNAAEHVLTLAPPTGHPPGAFGVKNYVLWNIREGLTKPGQWYHDRVNNRIVYWPLPGQDMSKIEVIAPTTAHIVTLRGKKDAIKNVTLRNLSFSVTTVPLIAGGFAADAYGGAIELENSQDCSLSGLRVAHVAGHAIHTRGSLSGLRVDHCDIDGCGAGGVYAGGTKTVITDNHIHGIGLLYPSAIGIYRGGKECTVAHNEVHDCSYCAINYGGESNTIEANLLYDCMKVLHDGAAIYLFGAKRCVIRGNVARDFTDSGGYGASAYYLDETCEECVVENNLALRVNWPSQNHMAKKNTLRHNVFIIKGDAKLAFARSSDYTMEKNVIYASGKIHFDNPDAVTTWTSNLFFSGANKIEGVKLNQYSPAGKSEVVKGDTVVADPLFEDIEKGDYRYKAGSPAEKLSIAPLDVSGVGPRKNAAGN